MLLGVFAILLRSSAGCLARRTAGLALVLAAVGLAWASVQVDQVTSEDDGSFAFAGVSPDMYFVSATHGGYFSESSETVSVSGGDLALPEVITLAPLPCSAGCEKTAGDPDVNLSFGNIFALDGTRLLVGSYAGSLEHDQLPFAHPG